MKLAPVTTRPQPAYPRRSSAKSNLGKTLRRAAVAVGTSALLGLSACGASEQHTEEIPLPGIMPAPELPGEVEPEDEEEAESEQLPAIEEEDVVHMRGGIRPVHPPPPPPENGGEEKPDESDASDEQGNNQVPPQVDPDKPPLTPPPPHRLAGIAPAPRF